MRTMRHERLHGALNQQYIKEHHTMKIIDEGRSFLVRNADRNGDGKVSIADVTRVLDDIKAVAQAKQTDWFHAGVTVTLAFIAGAAVALILFCH